MKVICCALFILLKSLFLYSADIPGAFFLDIGVGARASALGYAFSATASDVTALYWNPAGLIDTQTKQFGTSASFFYAGIFHSFIAYTHPLKNNQHIGLAFILLNSGEIDITQSDASNPEKMATAGFGSFRFIDMALTVSFAKLLFGVPVGVTGKFITEKLYNISATGAGLDMGVSYMLLKTPATKFSFTIRNLGYVKPENSKKLPLPLSLNLGVAVNYSKYNFLCEVKYPLYGQTVFKFGVEYLYPINYRLRIYPRAGYNTSNRVGVVSGNQYFVNDSMNGFTFGAGIAYKLPSTDLNFDYVIIPHSDLETVHKISVNLKF